ncbi:MAG: hypothetical protein LBD57_00400 [Endomicrobium sp.]|jgi:hypothetical protein|uniref:hypothetical protein n=1 Tax=Candidatus Endomicrobiellum cubanum TaxID=3242325 RepID=UPI002836EE31|nr:hypothetical protein [Endomicrobium sp.]
MVHVQDLFFTSKDHKSHLLIDFTTPLPPCSGGFSIVILVFLHKSNCLNGVKISMSNIYISIDGVDGVGKTTVAQTFVRKSILFELYSSPGTLFKEIRKEVDDLNNIIGRYAFYTLSCINDCKNISNLLQYSNVISDRSFISTTVYHSVLNNNIKI